MRCQESIDQFLTGVPNLVTDTLIFNWNHCEQLKDWVALLFKQLLP